MKRYTGEEADHIGFPLGGLGTGMLCLQGTGKLGSVSLRNRPAIYAEPNVFAAVCVKGLDNPARVLEGQVPGYKIFGFDKDGPAEDGNGLMEKNYGLPRFAESSFQARFPFATVTLKEAGYPLEVSLTGWSPFIPGDADRSGYPFAALEYTFQNTTGEEVQGVFTFNAVNFMKLDDSATTERRKDGFVFHQPGTPEAPWAEGALYAFIADSAAVDADWFRGPQFDTPTMLWKDICLGIPIDREADDQKSPGATAAVPFCLRPGEHCTIPVKLGWYVPKTDQRYGDDTQGDTYRPWYSVRFPGIDQLHDTIVREYATLRRESETFCRTFFSMTLPDEAMDAVSANLSILKSTTVLREASGRLWCWEGSRSTAGSCIGSCTHVWNYAQAICHLFPEMERSLRQTEFHESQDASGHQQFRSCLPIRPAPHTLHAAADGQLGGIMKLFREWKIKGDDAYLESMWEPMRVSLEYCIRTWDPDEEGMIKEPHHNTYDIEFWGPEPMCASFYIGALKAAALMAEQLGKDSARYWTLYRKARVYMENKLFNGEYFQQKIMGGGIHAVLPIPEDNPAAAELMQKEGPKYQYGAGCLSDGVLGAWMAQVCGVGEILDSEKVLSHLQSVYRYNFRRNLRTHCNPQRPGYALGNEGGLLLCSWPRGGKPSLPFIYSDEVWTGVEYQVASHLIMLGEAEKGLEIVKTCRARYTSGVRNPYDEYEWGHWYARALSSYALIEALTGVRYDAREQTLFVKGREASAGFLATDTGYGLAGYRDGKPFLNVVSGKIPVEKMIVLQ